MGPDEGKTLKLRTTRVFTSKHISKTQRLSNWEASSLTAAQRSYAAIDAWATLRIYLHLTSSDANNTSLVS